jgi:hypothetical protein
LVPDSGVSKGPAQDYSNFWLAQLSFPFALISSIDRASQIDARGSPSSGSLTCTMRQKLDTPSAVRIGARCPANTGNRRHQDVGGAARDAGARRRTLLTGAPNAQRRRKPQLAPLTRRRVPTFVAVGPEVVDDFPTPIPVALRELDVIETYLGALLDDALGKRE